MSTWSSRRQTMYALIVLGFVSLIAGLLYVWLKPVPSCFDRKKNQGELGVDCGGPCSLACRSQLVGISVLWERTFPAGKGKYDVVALVENPNRSFGVRNVGYKFRVFDENSVLVTEYSNKTFMSPGSKFLVFAPTVETRNRVATRAFLYFDEKVNWEKTNLQPPAISTLDRNFEPGPITRLRVKVRNESLTSIRDIQFGVVLSDADGNAYAVSQTSLDVLAGKEEKDIVFTWNQQLVDPVNIDIYPKIDVFAGI